MHCSTIHFLPDLDLYLLKFIGAVTNVDIFLSIDKAIDIQKISQFKKCLVDLRDCCLLFSENEIQANRNYVEERVNLHECHQVAFVGTRPQHTTAAVLFQIYNNSLFYQVEVFNTLVAGLNWLNLPLERHDDINLFFNKNQG